MEDSTHPKIALIENALQQLRDKINQTKYPLIFIVRISFSLGLFASCILFDNEQL